MGSIGTGSRRASGEPFEAWPGLGSDPLRGSIELEPLCPCGLLDRSREVPLLNSLKGESRRRARPCAFEPLGGGTSLPVPGVGDGGSNLACVLSDILCLSGLARRRLCVPDLDGGAVGRGQQTMTSASQRPLLPPPQTLPRPSSPRRRQRHAPPRGRDSLPRPPPPRLAHRLPRQRRLCGLKLRSSSVAGTSSGASTPESQLSTTPMTLVVLTCASIALCTISSLIVVASTSSR